MTGEPDKTGQTKTGKGSAAFHLPSRKDNAPRRSRGRGGVGREAIIKATRELLREVPPSVLNRKLVAEYANVDPGLLRYYFTDLKHLLHEVLRGLVDEYFERYDKLVVDPDKPEEALAKRVTLLVTFLAEEPSYHELFTAQIIDGVDDWAQETRDRITDTTFGSLNQIVMDGRARGVFRDDFDPRHVFIVMIGAAQFLGTSRSIFRRLFGNDETAANQAENYARFVSEVLLKGLRKMKG